MDYFNSKFFLISYNFLWYVFWRWFIAKTFYSNFSCFLLARVVMDGMHAKIREVERKEPLKNTQKSFSFQVIQSSRLLNWNKIKDSRWGWRCSSYFFRFRFFCYIHYVFFQSILHLCYTVLSCFYLRLSSVMFVLHLKT